MNIGRQFRRLGLFLLLLVAGLGTAHAQATRTWVSGVGDDANPCSRTAPCKTFAGAISKTAPAGTIDVLDPGGFGGVTIAQIDEIVRLYGQFDQGLMQPHAIGRLDAGPRSNDAQVARSAEGPRRMS